MEKLSGTARHDTLKLSDTARHETFKPSDTARRETFKLAPLKYKSKAFLVRNPDWFQRKNRK